jgi:hypothetical protein
MVYGTPSGRDGLERLTPKDFVVLRVIQQNTVVQVLEAEAPMTTMPRVWQHTRGIIF